VVNNSGGSTPSYSAGQNLNTGEFSAQTVAGWNSAAATGRGGLGTIVVKSSGNERVCCSVAFTGDASGDSLSGIEDLWGSSAADTLIGDAGNNSLLGFDGDDLLLDLSAIDADLTVGGNQSFTFGGTTATPGAASAGQLFTFQSGGNTFVSGGIDGDAVRDFLIELTSLLTLTAPSFIVWRGDHTLGQRALTSPG